MHAMSARRAARSTLTAAALMLLTVAGHTAGGGATPDVVAVLLAGVLAVGLATATSARRSRPWQVLTVLLGGQALLHVVLSLSGGHAHAVTTAVPGPAAIVAGHAVAALVASAVLLHADDLMERWLAFLASVVGGAVPCAPALANRPHPGTARRHPPAESLSSLLHQVIRRGPPAFAPA